MDVVITGATRGLGKALKTELERRGHTVASCSRPEVDVRDFPTLQRYAREHPCRLVIANAAVAIPGRKLWEIDSDDFATLLDTNVKGVFHTLKAFVPGMLASGGVVAVMSSDWGRSASPLVSAYCASKWALEGMVRAVSRELPMGVAAVLVDPGNVDTDMLRLALGPELARRYPGAEEWASRAARVFEELGPEHNGRSLRIPPGA